MNPIEWIYNEVLTSGASVTVPVGLHSGTLTFADCRGLWRLTYGLVSEKESQLIIRGSNDPAFATYEDFITHDTPAATFITPYQLGGNEGLNGYIVLPRPFIRIILNDSATADHSYTRLYVKAWG